MCWKTARPRRCRGVTYVEVVATLAIVLALIALLYPALGRVKDMVRVVACQAKQRRIMMASLIFASEHGRRIPATERNQGGAPSELIGEEDWQKCYMGNEAWPIPGDYEGVLVPYIDMRSDNDKLYRCPDLDEGVNGSGTGSNGKFDYVMFGVFSGASLSKIPLQARFTYPGGDTVVAPCVIYTEEDPFDHINRTNQDPGHTNNDRMGTWHLNGQLGNYAAVDGSVNSLEFAPGSSRPDTWNWEARAPSGAIEVLSGIGTLGYGNWNNR